MAFALLCLRQLAREGKPRGLDDLNLLRHGRGLHSRKIFEASHPASHHARYILPLIFDDQLVGVLCFDADTPCYFNHRVVEQLKS